MQFFYFALAFAGKRRKLFPCLLGSLGSCLDCQTGLCEICLLYTSRRFPKEGETVSAVGLIYEPGGKGYNQAVAAKRAGVEVYFATAVGRDFYGEQAAGSMKRDGLEPVSYTHLDVYKRQVVLGGSSVSGGIGSIWGTLIGVFILTMIENGLNMMNMNPYLQQMVKGLIIVIAVGFGSLRERKK